MRNVVITFLTCLTLVDCCRKSSTGVPEGAVLKDRWGYCTAFVEYRSTNAKQQERIWIYNSETESAELFLTCHKHRGMAFNDATDGVVWPRDSICGICNVKIVRWFDNNRLLVVEECDARNTYTYLVTDTSAVLLTSNEGYMGTLLDKGWHVTQSYCYYEDGGRFSVVKYFDDYGHLMKKEEMR